MKERLNIPVEPLSEVKWAKVRRGVLGAVDAGLPARGAPGSARTHRRAHRIVAYVAMAAAAAVLVFFGGRAWLGHGSSEFARISTSTGASRFTIGESTLEVDPDSTVLVRGDDEHGVSVMIERGAVTCEVAPRRGRPPFVVDSGDVRVRVVGTRFMVARDGSATRVHVDHGVVEVTARGSVAVLHDGEGWPAACPSPAGNLAPVAPSATATEAVAAAPTPQAGSVPQATRPVPPAAPRARHRSSANARSSAPPSDASEADSTSRSAPAAPPTAAADADDAARAPTPEEQFNTAARLERARPDQAETLYRRVAASRSPWAANALFALARLEADRGNDPAARTLLDQYIARYPHGTNAADARALRDHLR